MKNAEVEKIRYPVLSRFRHKTLVTDFVEKEGAALSFSAGDDLGVFPQNHPGFVKLVLSRLRPGSPGPEVPLLVETRAKLDTSYGEDVL